MGQLIEPRGNDRVTLQSGGYGLGPGMQLGSNGGLQVVEGADHYFAD